MVITVAVVVEVRFAIDILGAGAEREIARHRAGLRDSVSKCFVGVLRHDVALRIAIARDVAVVVVEGNIELELGGGSWSWRP